MEKDLFATVPNVNAAEKNDVTSDFYRKIEVQRFQSDLKMKEIKPESNDSIKK